MEPLISIIIPVYNSENTLERCIRSVLCQTYRNIEVIVVDNGSTDKSREIVKRLSKEDNRIVVIQQSNNGVSVARNAGLKKATGEYITFIDSDDWLEKDLYSAIVSLAQKEHADIVQWGFYVDDSENHSITRTKPYTLEIYDASYETVQMYFSALGYIWNKIYKREIINNSNTVFDKDIYLYEDMLFNLEILSNGYTVVNAEMYGTHYIQHSGSLGRKIDNNTYAMSVECLKRKCEHLIKYKVNKRVVDEYYSCEIVNILWMIVVKNHVKDTKLLDYFDALAVLKKISNRGFSIKMIVKYMFVIAVLKRNQIFQTVRKIDDKSNKKKNSRIY